MADSTTAVLAAGATPGSPRRAPITPGRFYAALAAVVLALGALSLLAPSTPSYDPWSWTVWARQIIHGHLTITDTGTSWKPLPMIATVPFALLGGAAPDLWLAVARAGAIAAVVMAFRLAHRLTRELALARTGAGAGCSDTADGEAKACSRRQFQRCGRWVRKDAARRSPGGGAA